MRGGDPPDYLSESKGPRRLHDECASSLEQNTGALSHFTPQNTCASSAVFGLWSRCARLPRLRPLRPDPEARRLAPRPRLRAPDPAWGGGYWPKPPVCSAPAPSLRTTTEGGEREREKACDVRGQREAPAVACGCGLWFMLKVTSGQKLHIRTYRFDLLFITIGKYFLSPLENCGLARVGSEQHA